MTPETTNTTSYWQTAFPIKPATDAVDAICESWRILAEKPRPGFHAGLREPVLTKALKSHVENVTARQRGLLGMWAAESIINKLDPETAILIEERRTDIVYGWNDATDSIQLVFEFKKLDRKARARKEYLGSDGLGRFVTGLYSCRQPIAAMVGILLDSFDDVVPPIQSALCDKTAISDLNICLRPDGAVYDQPSQLFTAADFDTEHTRPSDLAPKNGKIRVAHLFLPFQ